MFFFFRFTMARDLTPKPQQKNILPPSTVPPVRPFTPEVTPDMTSTQTKTEIAPTLETTTSSFDFGKVTVTNADATVSPPNINPGSPIQTKLTIGKSDDKYEQEADHVAKAVVQRLNSGQVHRQVDQMQPSPLPIRPMMQLPIQRQSSVPVGPTSDEFESNLSQARSGGSSLAPKVQSQMESSMGADFSGVKIHTDARADQLNRSIQAKAFTTGNDVFFKQGAYNPSSRNGQELIAHELTHVVQQNPGNIVERKIQRQEITPQKLDAPTATLQRTVAEAVNLANQYIGKPVYAPSFNQGLSALIEDLEDYNLTEDQIENIEDAYSAQLVQDESGNTVPFEPLKPEQKQDLAQRKRLLGQLSQTHANVLSYIEQQVDSAFGKTGVNQFYRGAHIIFTDGGTVYDGLFQRGRSLAANATQNPNPSGVMDKNTGAGTVGQGVKDTMNYWGPEWDEPVSNSSLSKQELDSGKMFKRRPEQSETSHYKGVQTDPNRPQLGIDFPIDVKGHLLFGVVPTDQQGVYNTFVQTEGAGFQNLYEHIIAHGKGAFDNAYGSWQTGLIGYSKQSEKTKGGSTAIKEQ